MNRIIVLIVYTLRPCNNASNNNKKLNFHDIGDIKLYPMNSSFKFIMKKNDVKLCQLQKLIPFNERDEISDYIH